MIIELEINGARVIISGENLTVNVTQDDAVKGDVVAKRSFEMSLPTADEIKALRKHLRMTQSEFATDLRVSQATVCRWELATDVPSGEAAVRLAAMLSEHMRSENATGIVALREWMNAIRGRASQLADALEITRAAIPQWREIPADKLIAIERITGISRQVLRPDLFEGMSA